MTNKALKKFASKFSAARAVAVIGFLTATLSFGGINNCAVVPDPTAAPGLGCATLDANFSNLSTSGDPAAGPFAGGSIIYGSGQPSGGRGTTAELFSITTGGVVTAIGSLGTTMNDIALYGGNMFGISGTSSLYFINLSTGASKLVGATGDVLNALTFSPTGVLYAAGGDNLYTINAATGAATKIGTGGTGTGTYASSGDLEFFNGVLYLTSTGTGANDELFSINTTTGQGTLIGTNLGFSKVYGLAQQGGILYAFTNSGAAGAQDLLTVNVATGVATMDTTYTLTNNNFGFNGTTDNADSSPEPGTLAAVGLGLAALVASFRRKRNTEPRT